MILNETFLNKYKKLPEITNIYILGPRSLRKDWRIRKVDFIQYIESGENEIDFLWHAIIFNLFSRTIYSFSMDNYKYCNDFLQWKYGHHDIMNKICMYKLKNFIDDNCRILPHNLHDKFYTYSTKKIPIYSQEFIDLVMFFGKECCDYNYRTLINEVINDSFFKEEFSEKENDLSNIFFKTLSSQI